LVEKKILNRIVKTSAYTIKMKDKHRTRKQLADDLGVSTRTLARKLVTLKIDLPSGLISPNVYAKIIEKFRG